MKLAIVLVCFALGAAAQPAAVLEDFEAPGAAARWQPSPALSVEHASHGARSGEVRLAGAREEVGFAPTVTDWRPYRRLLFDVFSQRPGTPTLSLRIYDQAGADPDHYYEARSKIPVLPGWNHIEVKLASLVAASFSRSLALDHIVRITLFADRTRLPWTVWVDNFRLAGAGESPATASRTKPEDGLTILDGRWFTLRQVGRPEEVPESAEVASLREQAAGELRRLEASIRAARLQGIDTIYAERHLVTADLGLNLRPRLAWFNHDAGKRELFTYVRASCLEARRELEDLLGGVSRLPHVDDTQAGEPLVPPYPPLKSRPMKDWFFVDERGRPMLVISVHSPSAMLERFFASPRQHIESYTVGGGSRWTIDDSPVYEAFHQHPDARRVGWDGWCGHLIRDLHSMGGTKMENVVICLESPAIREAVEKYIRLNIPKFHDNPQLLYDIMAYELMYVCYCDRSQRMFRQWLAKKHGAVEKANQSWGTSYRRFDDVTAPPVRGSRPLPDTNRALWYDWARFNQDRFTDYLLWVRSRIRELDASVPLAAGGSSSMLAGRTGTTGIDEERIVNEVDDVIIHEGGGSTLGVDLQLAFAETRKPLADPEMSLRSVHDLLPHALHGKSVMQFFHWPAQPQNEFFSMNLSSLPHSPNHSLADVGELLRATLDARRLSREIAAFVDAPAEVAILYSQTATLQLPPEMLTWAVTPYLAELEKTYEAARYLDARITFVTERQILNGRLRRHKLLLIPAVRNLPAAVVEAVWKFARAGGLVMITPESLLGDEYNRPRDFLAALGIAVERTERPAPGKVGRMVQGYDQSFAQQVTEVDSAPVKLKPEGIEAQGVRQRLRVPAAARVLHQYPDGSPAVVRLPQDRGAIYYSAASLEERSYARLLEAVFQDAAIARPIRLRHAATEGPWRVEARLPADGRRKLLYAINYLDTPARFRLSPPPGELRDLRAPGTEVHLAGDAEIEVPARQTAIWEVR